MMVILLEAIVRMVIATEVDVMILVVRGLFQTEEPFWMKTSQ